MVKSLFPVTRPTRRTETGSEASVSHERPAPARAGQIGPIRREIIFEPVHEQPAPAESPPAPQPQPREPVPDRS
jgi:hypothetical protein